MLWVPWSMAAMHSGGAAIFDDGTRRRRWVFDGLMCGRSAGLQVLLQVSLGVRWEHPKE